MGHDGCSSRFIQRRVLADVLPPAIRERRDKADFTLGVIHSFRSLIEENPAIAQVPGLAALGVVEPSQFTPALDRALQGICDEDQSAIFAATTYEGWLQANGYGRGGAESASLGAVAAWAAPC